MATPQLEKSDTFAFFESGWQPEAIPVENNRPVQV